MADESPQVGLLRPLANSGFALIAAATLVSNVGVWMRDTTSAWTMAGHSQHHSAVALVQAATTFPVLILALPAGVLADHFDRRRLLILCQLALAAVGGLLAFLSFAGELTTGRLVLLAFAAGSAAALAGPAWQAIVPTLVSREEIRSAVALSSIGFNISRVIGPGVGGAILVAAGAGAAYACNALAYLATILALLVVRPPGSSQAKSAAIRFGDELHQGLLFLGQSAPFRAVVLRGAALYFMVSCYLTLTPLIAHDVLKAGAEGYGTLLAAIGIGSIGGGVVLSFTHRFRVDDETLLAGCAVASFVALVALSQATDSVAASLALALAGCSTLIQLATFNGVTQLILPETIRGRGLSIYMAVTFGAMAVGSLLWGSISDVFSVEFSLGCGACGFAVAGLAGRRLTMFDRGLASETTI